MSRSFELPEAEWAAIGAIGEPGRRTFYLQAGQSGEKVTLKLEKQHVQALSQFLAEILSDLPAPEDHPSGSSHPGLQGPIEADWAAGGIRLTYDRDVDRIMLFAEEVDATAEPDELPSLDADGTATIGLTRRQAAALIAAGAELLSTGRPLCSLCGQPMDPAGHSCPRTNGHRPH